jgi:aminomethyltransferase
MIIDAGAEWGIMPCGLASRDILRLEMGFLQYGNDIDETRTPIEAGLGHFVDLKKDFIGKDPLTRLKSEGTEQRLAGFLLLEKSLPRTGGSIFSENREIGVVTSGGISPSLRKGFGLGYVVSRYAQPGQEIEIEIRDREFVAKIVELPFYKKK